MFSLESLGEVTKALAEGDAKKMLDVVADLEANGRSLQHFARELARYFRNLLVVRIEGKTTRLVAASPPEQERMLTAARQFTEDGPDAGSETVARFVPGFAKLTAAASASGNGPAAADSRKPVAANRGSDRDVRWFGEASGIPSKSRSPKPAASTAAPAPTTGDFRTRLTGALAEAKLTHVADAVEHSESPNPQPRSFSRLRKCTVVPEGAEFEAAVRRVAGRTVRIT
jgi:DNA polymerase-3 subunit gamma/tau